LPWLPPLSSSEFYELLRLFNEAAGLSFDASALPVFQQRLASRLPLHEVDNFRDYLRLLEFGPGSSTEMAAALDLITSGETYFFRHDEQLQIFAETILPAVAHSNASRRRISIWSAGCSSGEEAYTAAILVQESGLFQGWNVRIAGPSTARSGSMISAARSTPSAWASMSCASRSGVSEPAAAIAIRAESSASRTGVASITLSPGPGPRGAGASRRIRAPP